MLCKCHWIVLYTVHFTAFCLGGGGRFVPDTVYIIYSVVSTESEVIGLINGSLCDMIVVHGRSDEGKK